VETGRTFSAGSAVPRIEAGRWIGTGKEAGMQTHWTMQIVNPPVFSSF
jgi:hypothetical protein